MNVDLNETVTISLDNYNSMVKQIKKLKEDVAQKEIIVETKPKWFEIAQLAAIFLIALSIIANWLMLTI